MSGLRNKNGVLVERLYSGLQSCGDGFDSHRCLQSNIETPEKSGFLFCYCRKHGLTPACGLCTQFSGKYTYIRSIYRIYCSVQEFSEIGNSKRPGEPKFYFPEASIFHPIFSANSFSSICRTARTFRSRNFPISPIQNVLLNHSEPLFFKSSPFRIPCAHSEKMISSLVVPSFSHAE